MINRVLNSIAMMAVVVAIGCSDTVGPALIEGELEQGIGLAVNLAGAPEIMSVRLEVTAADIEEPIVVLLPIRDGVAGGTVHVPIGTQRKFLLQALDGDGIVRYEGSAVADVVAGVNPTVTIALLPVQPTGEIPIVGTIGTYSIVLNVQSITLRPGQFVVLEATVRDPTGAIVPDPSIGWLSTNASVAPVDGNGRVVARSTGTTDIWAGFQDLRAIATVTVAP